MNRFPIKSLAIAAAVTLSACGGGGTADTSPKLKITAVKVFGDSIADSGTYGFKFTVQSADNLIFPERVAASYGQTLCSFYKATGPDSFVPNPKAGCTNAAIGGGRINYYSNPTDPRGITVQMAAVAALGSYSPGDLTVIDGGGNDAADLVGAYLKAPSDKAASYAGLLTTVLTPAQVGAALAGGAAGMATIGGVYMTALADNFYAAIKTSVLDKGAQQVIVLNMPGITNTPRFQMVLDGISAAYGGGTAGATARAQSEALFKSWIEAFNKQLAAKFAGEAKVAVVDFYTAFNDQVATPAQFGLSNVKTPACPITGLGSDGLPTYSFPTCTATALSAAPPAGATGGADWWKSYGFSDGFHPTPYGHQLTGQLISKTLAIKGWL